MTALPEGEPRGCIPLYPNGCWTALPEGEPRGCIPLSPNGCWTALPEGEPRGCIPLSPNGCWAALPEGEPRGCIPLYPNFMMWLLGSSPRGESQGAAFHCPRMAVGQLSQRESQGAAPRYIACWHEKWSVSVSIRSIHCFTTTPQKDCGGLFASIYGDFRH